MHVGFGGTSSAFTRARTRAWPKAASLAKQGSESIRCNYARVPRGWKEEISYLALGGGGGGGGLTACGRPRTG